MVLEVRPSARGRQSVTDAARFVGVGYPGGGRPGYAGGLYRRMGPSYGDPFDLHGHAFQHGKRGAWFMILHAGGNEYVVEPTGADAGAGR